MDKNQTHKSSYMLKMKTVELGGGAHLKNFDDMGGGAIDDGIGT